MPSPVLALEIGRTGQTRSCLCEADILVGEARQGTSEISKQDHFPVSAVRKIKHTWPKEQWGRGLVCNSYLRGTFWRR